jgi:hypothetical protein
VIINFLIFFTTLSLFCGLALDVGIMQLRKLQLQHGADAAALGAVMEKARGNSDWIAAGKADASLNGFTDGVNGVTITIQNPPTSGTYSGDTTAIQATVQQRVHTAFLVFLGMNYASPAAMAVAKGSNSPGCVYAMNSGSSIYPITLQSSSQLSSACDVYVDSSNKSIKTTSGTSLAVTNSKAIKVQGASSGASLAGSVSPSPTYGSANENDPLSGVTSPAYSGCTTSGGSSLFPLGNPLLGWLLGPTAVNLNPGTYCGGLWVSWGNIHFSPGIYIITGSSTLTSSTLTGTGVTIFLTQGGGSGYGTFAMNSVTATLTAPTTTSSSGVAGIVFFGDRNWSAPGSQGIQISGSTITTDGIWYILNTGISASSSTLQGTNYIGFVVDNLSLSQSTVTVPSPDYSSLSGGAPYAGGSSAGGIVQ